MLGPFLVDENDNANGEHGGEGPSSEKRAMIMVCSLSKALKTANMMTMTMHYNDEQKLVVIAATIELEGYHIE